MRKFVYTALLILALGCFAGATVAYAGDCCQPKCKQHSCTKCDKPCGECKHKCDTCKPKCEPCKPKCDTGCKPKCDKCKQDTCSTCKPKCENKCDKCSPCKDKCGKCDSCKPKCNKCEASKDECGMCAGGPRHPYEDCWNGTGMLCDTGCDTFLPCKRECVTCETVCKEVKTVDPCTGCESVDYVTETVCHEIERPTVIPWWFNEKGDGNIYVDEKAEETPAAEAK
jgi:hypothetical protein